MAHVFFSVGDPSGDLHAANVIRRLQGFRVSGIGGDAMAAAGMRSLCHIRELAVMGFWEVARQYPRLRGVLRRTCRFIAQNKVDLLVCVDYPGFNLRLAAFARSRRIPVLYYIAPKVWAWGQWRVRKMRKVIDRLAVIFPFEEAYFNDRGVPARFVGNPLLELDYPQVSEKEFREALGFAPGSRILGVLPGSRPGEVQRLLPELVRAAGTLLDQGRFDACAVSRAQNVPESLLAGLPGGDGRIKIYADSPAPVLKYADFLFVKSGTATLEAALNLKPFITVYKTSPATFFLAKRLVKIRQVSMANIVLGRAVVPELLQDRAWSGNMVREARALLDSPERLRGMISAFETMKKSMGDAKASENVSTLIKEMVHG